MEDSQGKWILLLRLSGAVPLDRIRKVGFPVFSARQNTGSSLGRDIQDVLREEPLS